MTEIDDEDILAIPKNMETLSLPNSPKSNLMQSSNQSEPFFGYNSLLQSVNKSTSPTKSHLSAKVEPFNPSNSLNQRHSTSEIKSSPEAETQSVFPQFPQQSFSSSVFIPPPPLPISSSNVPRNNSYNNLAGPDDISTIFVVGFPDDMTVSRLLFLMCTFT